MTKNARLRRTLHKAMNYQSDQGGHSCGGSFTVASTDAFIKILPNNLSANKRERWVRKLGVKVCLLLAFVFVVKAHAANDQWKMTQIDAHTVRFEPAGDPLPVYNVTIYEKRGWQVGLNCIVGKADKRGACGVMEKGNVHMYWKSWQVENTPAVKLTVYKFGYPRQGSFDCVIREEQKTGTCRYGEFLVTWKSDQMVNWLNPGQSASLPPILVETK